MEVYRRQILANHPRKLMAQASEQPESTMRLEANLPDWCALSWRHALTCCCFVAMFLFFSYLPLSLSSTWHAVWTGGVIADHGLYEVDPSLPLADGMRQHAGGWLGRMIVHQLFQRGGLELLSFSFAVLQTLTVVMWALLFIRISGRWWTSLLAIAVVLCCSPQIDGLTTATLGQLCFAIFVCLLFGDTDWDKEIELLPSIFQWVAILSTMMFWTNVDSSFVLGWAIVLLLFLARLIELLSRPTESRVMSSVFADPRLRQRLILFELCVFVSLANPIGWKLHQTLLWWPDQPTWQAFGGWQPLSLACFQGILLAAVWGFWQIASRYAPQVLAWQWLLPVAGTVLVATCQPTLPWVAPLMVLASISLLPEVKLIDVNSNDREEQVPLRFAFTLVCGLALWVGFALSPGSYQVLGGQGRNESQVLSSHHPSAAIKFLQASKHDVQTAGLLWCPNYWSDCLQTPTSVMHVFANQNMLAIPAQARSDYQTIFFGQDSWRKLLDQYDVDRILIDKERQPRLLRNLRRQPGDWKIAHEDGKAIVLTRVTNT